ncbi:7507_t:CDS:2 [Scutellospora calospora]|uniref:7507_t:CDS:1 n=1 Tax=Scutellospora calospora TaxID=85575 RepID=A0ACA9LQH7_9GLOM|nr:7507_t:CDS:2 [Scutellospora calospora]
MSQEYQQHPFPPTFQSERSWSMLANDFDDDKPQHYYPSQASDRSWSVLGSQDISDRNHGLSTYGYVADDINSANSARSIVQDYIDQQQQISAERTPTIPSSFPEPEFVPSITSSTKEFLYETFKYERQNDKDIAGRPNEYVDDDCSDCPPPPSDLDLSVNSQINLSQSQTESNSWRIGYLSGKFIVSSTISESTSLTLK